MARTVVNLPFIGPDGNGQRYEPGAMIPHAVFEQYAEAAAKVVDDRTDKDEGASPLPTADSVVDEFVKYGSITTDPNDGIHPDHVLPDPNQPSLASLVSQAEALVAKYEEEGVEVPAKLRALAEISDRQINATEASAATRDAQGTGGDK